MQELQASQTKLSELDPSHTGFRKAPPLILHNGKIATNGTPSFVQAVAIEGGKIAATGADTCGVSSTG